MLREVTPIPQGEKETESGSELGSSDTKSLAICTSFQLPSKSRKLARPWRPSIAWGFQLPSEKELKPKQVPGFLE